ncbi:hypothetical protein AMIS_4180 [Actinoplanes missouriensis 431]|uniref:Uncharacterized protein n=2 Tax=Actinoplanes missouriensis TaxID=1866 RepID=I0GY01_ACTM4|nr:hypothetical protein AMIS_4180 [Actinoplanes missouriensis 431]
MIRMIGGEMPEHAEQRAPVGGELYRHLLGRLPTGTRVLVAGPHHTGLLDTLADGRTVTCLVRSQPDAEALADRGFTVLCGTLAKITDTDRYDVVVALDGTSRLCSPEGPQLDWAEAVRVLKRALRPGGTLLLTVENELGVHRLVDPGTVTALTSAATAAEWRPLGEFGTAPGRPDRLAAALGAEGLPVSGLAAAWPSQAEPSLLVTPETLRYGPLDALAALASGAVATAYQGKAVLSDPRRLASAAVRRGLGAELAPAWLAVAQLAGRPTPVVPVPPVSYLRGGTVVAGTGSLPAGRLLEELLLTAALGHDLPALRRLLTGWTAALPAATADNVLVEDDRYTLLDESRPEQPDALARFASTLTLGGYAHPWPAITDVARLTEVLAGAAGLEAAPPAPEPAAAPGSRRDHEQQLTDLRRRLADAEARGSFFETELEKRDAELGRAKVQIAAFSGSFAYRAAKAGLGIARKARHRLHKGQQ